MRLAAPEYIVMRRFSNKAWRRRHIRALCLNNQHRIPIRRKKEMEQAAEEQQKRWDANVKTLQAIKAQTTATVKQTLASKCKALFKRLGHGR